MPFYNPVISTVTPQRIGGTPSAGVSKLAAADDHVHPFTEAAGPTNLAIANILDTEMVWRTGTNLQGRYERVARTTANLNNNTTTLSNLVQITVPRSGNFIFEGSASYNCAATTTGLQLAFDFTGTTSLRKLVLMKWTDQAGSYLSSNTTSFVTKIGVANVGPTSGTDAFFHYWGMITATSAGTLSIQFASGVAASNVSVQRDMTCWLMEDTGA